MKRKTESPDLTSLRWKGLVWISILTESLLALIVFLAFLSFAAYAFQQSLSSEGAQQIAYTLFFLFLCCGPLSAINSRYRYGYAISKGIVLAPWEGIRWLVRRPKLSLPIVILIFGFTSWRYIVLPGQASELLSRDQSVTRELTKELRRRTSSLSPIAEQSRLLEVERDQLIDEVLLFERSASHLSQNQQSAETERLLGSLSESIHQLENKTGLLESQVGSADGDAQRYFEDTLKPFDEQVNALCGPERASHLKPCEEVDGLKDQAAHELSALRLSVQNYTSRLQKLDSSLENGLTTLQKYQHKKAQRQGRDIRQDIETTSKWLLTLPQTLESSRADVDSVPASDRGLTDRIQQIMISLRAINTSVTELGADVAVQRSTVSSAATVFDIRLEAARKTGSAIEMAKRLQVELQRVCANSQALHSSADAQIQRLEKVEHKLEQNEATGRTLLGYLAGVSSKVPGTPYILVVTNQVKQALVQLEVALSYLTKKERLITDLYKNVTTMKVPGQETGSMQKALESIISDSEASQNMIDKERNRVYISTLPLVALVIAIAMWAGKEIRRINKRRQALKKRATADVLLQRVTQRNEDLVVRIDAVELLEAPEIDATRHDFVDRGKLALEDLFKGSPEDVRVAGRLREVLDRLDSRVSEQESV